MDEHKLSAKYTVRKLTDADIPAILALQEGNPLFFRHCPPPPSAQGVAKDLRALPPGMTAADKFYVGFFEGHALVALLDLILGYPGPKTAFVGFFMTDAARQGKGLGSALVEEITDHLKICGFSAVRLAYVKGDPQSRAFWLKNRFLETGTESKTGDYTMVVMQRVLEKEATLC